MRTVRENLLANCLVTPRDVTMMNEMSGPIIPGLKGKQPKRKQNTMNQRR